MTGLNPTLIAHRFASSALEPGDHCIDATVGNGYDTAFLAEIIGDGGKVLGLDIQEAAIDRTRERLEECDLLSRVILEQKNHQEIQLSVRTLDWPAVRLIMFNLGYLPGSDKSIITQRSTTISALNSCLELLSVKGALSIVAYRGHPGGFDEYLAVQQWMNELPSNHYFTLQFERGSITESEAPVFFWVRRLC